MYLILIFALALISYVTSESEELPANWKDLIAPDVFEKYNGVGNQGFSSDHFQGDISGIDRSELSAEISRGVALNNAIADVNKRWENGIIPYTMSELYNDDDRRVEKTLIQLAMDTISSSTSMCIRFVKRTTETDYVHITRGMSCNSLVGRNGGKQVITLTRGCLEEIGAIQHEFMHALGFYHENSRADRDDYIYINWNNLEPRAKADFQIPTDAVTFGVPYDYESVMHYRWNAFAVNASAPTIVPKQPGGKRIGQSTNLSVLDIYKLRRAYNCPGTIDIFTQTDKAKTPGRTTPGKEEPEEPTQATTKAGKKRTKRPTLPTARLPNYKMKVLSDAECESLNTKTCWLLSSASCKDAYYDYSCSANASNFDVRFLLNKMKRVLPDSPVVLGLFGMKALVADNFKVISENVIRIHLHDVSGLDCKKLKDLPLPNLLQLDILDSTGITIGKESFTMFKKLRMLAFRITSIKSIEKGAFESLTDLKMLALDWGITAPFRDDIQEHLFRFHCEEEYSWLRDYLKEKPELLEPRRDGEIYSVGGIQNWDFRRRDIYYNVDCNREDLTGYTSQTEFSILTPS